MSNNIINSSQYASMSYQSTYASVTKTTNGNEESLSAIYETLDINAGVTLELGSSTEKAAGDATYKPDMDKVSAMKADLNKNIDAFKQMVLKLFDKQGSVGNTALDNLHNLIGKLENSGGIDALTQEKAQEMISEDGYWGVEKTSQRILDFAKALSGGDPSKIDLLKKAVEDGFSQAEALWGGELPVISNQTYDKVMQGFEEWANPGSTAAAETSAE